MLLVENNQPNSLTLSDNIIKHYLHFVVSRKDRLSIPCRVCCFSRSNVIPIISRNISTKRFFLNRFLLSNSSSSRNRKGGLFQHADHEVQGSLPNLATRLEIIIQVPVELVKRLTVVLSSHIFYWSPS